jgi:nucleoside-diphosphate-sugar epimerase
MNSKSVEMIQRDCFEVVSTSLETLENLRNRSIYITGGTGFVGTWLAEIITFLNSNYGFNTDLFLVSRDVESFRQKAPHLAQHKHVQLLSLDVRNIIDIPKDVNYIIHAAATPDNRQHMSNPLGVMETITKGTSAVLDAATKLPNLIRILNISSGQIYGKLGSETEMIAEDYAGGLVCNSITSVYPEAKRYAETLCCAYWSLYKLPVVTARPFAFIGPYQGLDKPWAVNNFLRDALMNNTIRIIGNGLPVRSYLYPSDMANWLLNILISGKSGSAYNVGSPKGITLSDLANKIKQFSNSSSKIEIKGMNEDSSRFIPDVTLCRQSLMLNAQVDIDEALKRTISWLKETTR